MKRSGSGESTSGLTGIESHASAVDSGFATPGAIMTWNVVFEPRPSVIFMNQHAYDSLTAGQRNVLVRAAAEARAAPIFEGNDTASVRDLCRRGIKIVSASPADLAGLRAAVQPVYRTLSSNPATRAFIGQITAMRKAAGGTPGAVTCPPATAAVGSAGGALQGTWQVTYTEKELAAAGADPSELLPSEGNWGAFTLKFSHGHWWDTGTKATAYGTYAVTGDRITFYRHDHNYAGSDTEVWGPYLWSVYRDTLTFKKDAGTQGPTGLVVKPWRKTGV